MRLRILTNEGVSKFRSYLQSLKEGQNVAIPLGLLTDESCSADLFEHVDIETRQFADKRAAAEFISDLLKGVRSVSTDSHAGLWSWLSLFFFDQLCPADGNGLRQPGEDYRYILSPDYRYYYRHLLAGPYRILKNHPASARTLLSGTISKLGDFTEQVASRQEFVSNPGLVGALDALYFDVRRTSLKSGCTNRKKPGTLRRFIDVVQQFELTFDLYSMSPGEILSLLPKEFEPWKA